MSRRHPTRRSHRRRTLSGLATAALLLITGAATVNAADGPAAPAPFAPFAQDAPVGFGAGTTGGGNATPVTVTGLAAFQDAVAGDEPKVVQVDGTFQVDGMIPVGSNTTILGVGSGSGFSGGGLAINDVTNVIVRNMNISKPLAPSDAIQIQRTTQVWIDHNTLSADTDHDKDYYDGLLDLTHAADNVTVSWNRFEHHSKGSLVGHSDSNGDEDTGRLHVTYHHNYFNDVFSRLPSLRFGTAHVFNNYYDTVDTAAHSRMGAQMLVENNVFRNTKLAITTMRSSDEDGYANERGNDFGGAATEISQTGSFTSPPYAYSADATDSVVATVTAGAGAGRL